MKITKRSKNKLLNGEHFWLDGRVTFSSHVIISFVTSHRQIVTWSEKEIEGWKMKRGFTERKNLKCI